MEQNKRKGGFLPVLLGTIAGSLLRSKLTRKRSNNSRSMSNKRW